jgi:hypothetical protein
MGAPPVHRWGSTGVVALGCAMLLGCGKAVRVVDHEGRPVVGAGVTAIYPSFNGVTTYTDVDGNACVSSTWAGTAEWLSVSAPGFVSVSEPFPRRWPQTFRLAIGHDQPLKLPASSAQSPAPIPRP